MFSGIQPTGVLVYTGGPVSVFCCLYAPEQQPSFISRFSAAAVFAGVVAATKVVMSTGRKPFHSYANASTLSAFAAAYLESHPPSSSRFLIVDFQKGFCRQGPFLKFPHIKAFQTGLKNIAKVVLKKGYPFL